MLSIKDIEHPFRTANKEVCHLSGVTLQVESGEIYGIVGRNDSGKGTLLRCIGMLERPLTGMVSIDKQNLTVLESKELRKARVNIGYVSHSPNLIHSKNILDNITLPLEIAGIARNKMGMFTDPVLTVTNLADKVNSFPQHLNQLEKVKAAIARAVINKPKILLCDEITSGLDVKSTQAIIRLLKRINQETKTSVILITHDIDMIKTLCDTVGVMDRGELVEEATTLDFIVHPKTEISQDFIKSYTRCEIPMSLRRGLRTAAFNGSHPIIRLAFYNVASPEGLLAHVIDYYQAKVNIIQGHQEEIQKQQVNILIAEFNGAEQAIADSLAYLQQNNINTQVLGYVA